MENYYKRKRDDSVEAAEGTSVPEPEPLVLVLEITDHWYFTDFRLQNKAM